MAVSDSLNTPVLISIKTYDHTSALFSVAKGYSINGNISVLQYCGNINSSFACILGARLLKNGALQICLNKPKENNGSYVIITANTFNSYNSELNSTLVLDEVTPAEDVVSEVIFEDRTITSEYFKGHLKGTADFANNLSSNPIISSGTTNPNSITVSAGYKLSNEFVVPYSNTAGSVAIETNPVNDYKPIVVHEGNSLFSSDTGDDVPMCNFYTGELKAKTFTGTLNGAASDLSGHNESSLESFNFRASAGERSIKDDFANVKAIYGNSVV